MCCLHSFGFRTWCYCAFLVFHVDINIASCFGECRVGHIWKIYIIEYASVVVVVVTSFWILDLQFFGVSMLGGGTTLPSTT